MSTRMFALLIGIDNYKSGSIWNLESCCADVKNIKKWLRQDMHVPREHIRLLLDGAATKCGIEDAFVSHLVNNPEIERGDAILLYFSGHGSSLPAPEDWYTDGTGTVDVLCTYDYDTRGPEGRVTGIPDRTLRAMLHELHAAKGDNITVVLDCGFSPPRTRTNMRDRRMMHWTPTTKSKPEDLLSGLWEGALKIKNPRDSGFSGGTHILLTACLHGEQAVEGPDGGTFTAALLHAFQTLPLHETTYNHFVDHLTTVMADDSQTPLCLGRHKDRVLFNGVPFTSELQFLQVLSQEGSGAKLRINAGLDHKIQIGTLFSVHRHNQRGSSNRPLATVRVVEVHPTWCIAHCQIPSIVIPDGSWARIMRSTYKTSLCRYVRKMAWLMPRWTSARVAVDEPLTGLDLPQTIIVRRSLA